MKLQIVEVLWRDACSFDEIYDIDSNHFKTDPVCSRGMLLSQTKKEIVIARDLYGEEGDYRVSGVLTIPTNWVKSIRVIEE